MPADQKLPPPTAEPHQCGWCGCAVWDEPFVAPANGDHAVDPGAGHAKFPSFDADGKKHGTADKWYCSEICRSILAGTHWPTPAGPATHDELEHWVALREEQRMQVVRDFSGALAAWAQANPTKPYPTEAEIEARITAMFRSKGLL